MNISVSLDLIDPNPWQTRIGEPDAEYLKVLSEDIKRNGLLQFPVGRLVREDGREVGGVTEWEDLVQVCAVRVQLAFGHNRVAALRLLDWGAVNVEVRRLSDEQMADFAWSENEKRRAHSPLERAMAMQQRVTDFGWTQAQVAAHLGVSRPVVANALRLLKLPEDVRTLLHEGLISERVAMSLLSLYDLPSSLLERAKASGMAECNFAILGQAIKDGTVSSEDVRKMVDRIVYLFARRFDSVSWDLDAEIDHVGAVSKACRDCHCRFKDRNICVDLDCFNARKRFFEHSYLSDASSASGIKIGIQEQESFGFWDPANNQVIKQALALKCENLKLIYRRQGFHADDTVDGFNDAQIVCQAKGGMCKCQKAVREAARTMQADKVEVVREMQAAISEQYDHENVEAAREVFVGQLVDGLARKDAGAWRFLNAACVLHGAREPGNEDIARAFMYNLARWLVDRKCPDYQGVEGVRAIMREVLG